MTGHYFECDACHVRDFNESPPVGWIGMTQVTGSAMAGMAEDHVVLKEMHACSASCAVHLLMPVDDSKPAC